MSRDQNAGRSHSTKIDNSSFESMEEFKYFGKPLTNQYSIQEEIESRLKSGNACYHSVQNLLSSSLLSKNLKIKIYRTTSQQARLISSQTPSPVIQQHTSNLVHSTHAYLPVKMEQSVPKRRHINFRCRRFTQKKAYNTWNTAKFYRQETKTLWRHYWLIISRLVFRKQGLLKSVWTGRKKVMPQRVCGAQKKMDVGKTEENIY
jgi:hypothetical protein